MVCRSLFVVSCLLFVVCNVCCSVFVVRLFVVCRSLLGGSCLLCDVCCLLFAVCCSLFVVCCLLRAVR